MCKGVIESPHCEASLDFKRFDLYRRSRFLANVQRIQRGPKSVEVRSRNWKTFHAQIKANERICATKTATSINVRHGDAYASSSKFRFRTCLLFVLASVWIHQQIYLWGSEKWKLFCLLQSDSYCLGSVYSGLWWRFSWILNFTCLDGVLFAPVIQIWSAHLKWSLYGLRIGDFLAFSSTFEIEQSISSGTWTHHCDEAQSEKAFVVARVIKGT